MFGGSEIRRILIDQIFHQIEKSLLSSFLLVRGPGRETVAAGVLGGLVPLAAGTLLLLVLAWSPAPQPPEPERLPQPLAHRFLPGLADLCGGAATRGYMTLATGTFSIVAVLTKASYAAGYAVGPMSADASWWFPRVIGLSEQRPWADLWIYRDAPLWWLLVVLSLALSIGLQLKGRRPASPR